MGKPKSRDLWQDAEGTKSVNRPQNVTVAKGWKVTPDLLPAKPLAPRRRKYAPIRPNNRDAVAVPLGGQSYNPLDEEHQDALRQAVRQLSKRKVKDERYVKMMMLGRDHKYTGNFSADKTWDEEVQETAPAKAATPPNTKKSAKPSSHSAGAPSSPASSPRSTSRPAAPTGTESRSAKRPMTASSAAAPATSTPAATPAAKESNAAMKKKKNETKKKKKKTKKASAQDAKRAMAHRRHPQRDVVEKETEELDALLSAHEAKEDKRAEARQRRRAAKKENIAVKHYGRHYHTALAIDVAPSDKLVGSLRHLSGGYVHPALERMKSLEERNLVPARMRHTYNKRKVLKAKGQVRLKREEFGIMPETSF
ncbi:hypothetical protein NESM_000502800 [Novymonas esmeraldas]|uniref:Ribosome biogenesis protein NOP53 n=1 Tax=Novymonas esmeraldas TaxID=1808958 RepID=A0AAW0ES06_9TRYP